MYATTHLTVVMQGLSARSACKVRTASHDSPQIFQHHRRRHVLCTAWRRRM